MVRFLSIFDGWIVRQGWRESRRSFSPLPFSRWVVRFLAVFDGWRVRQGWRDSRFSRRVMGLLAVFDGRGARNRCWLTCWNLPPRLMRGFYRWSYC